MRRVAQATLAALVFCMLSTAPAWAVIVADEDFEGGAVGWTNNTTINAGGVFSEFLAGFGDSAGVEVISKEFALDGNDNSVSISFDVYEVDKWEDDVLRIFIDGVAIADERYTHNENDFLDGSAANASRLIFGDGIDNFGFGAEADQGYHYEFVVNTAATIISVGFGSIIPGSVLEAFFGIDNLLIEASSNETASSDSGSEGGGSGSTDAGFSTGSPTAVAVSHPSAPMLMLSMLCFVLVRHARYRITADY